MPWTPPSDPVTSTVITVAYAVANLLTQIRWLRLMTGNADPPGSSYVVVADSTAATSWRKVPADALADGVALANLGYTPVNKAGDTNLGGMTSTGTISANVLGAVTNVVANGTVAGGVFNGGSLLSGGVSALGLAAGNNGITSSGLVQVANVTSSGTVQAATVTASGTVQATTVTGTTVTANGQLVSTVVTGTPPLNVSSATLVPNLNAAQVGGRTPTATSTANSIPISDASGKLDAWVTPASFSIPSGVGIWVRQASEIPTGFLRETSLDGLMLIGAGTSFSQTFTEQQTYGNTWQHQHAVPSLTVAVTTSVSGSATGGTSDNTGQPSATGGTASGTPPPSFGTGTHTHSLNGVSLAVSASGTGSGSTTASNTGNLTWLPPMRAVVYARKT